MFLQKNVIEPDQPKVVPVSFSEDSIPVHKRKANWVLDIDGDTNDCYSVDSKGQICQFKGSNQHSIKVSNIL